MRPLNLPDLRRTAATPPPAGVSAAGPEPGPSPTPPDATTPAETPPAATSPDAPVPTIGMVVHYFVLSDLTTRAFPLDDQVQPRAALVTAVEEPHNPTSRLTLLVVHPNGSLDVRAGVPYADPPRLKGWGRPGVWDPPRRVRDYSQFTAPEPPESTQGRW